LKNNVSLSVTEVFFLKIIVWSSKRVFIIDQMYKYLSIFG